MRRDVQSGVGVVLQNIFISLRVRVRRELHILFRRRSLRVQAIYCVLFFFIPYPWYVCVCVFFFLVFAVNMKQVLAAGADSIAVISAITKADNVEEAVRQWGAVFEASSCSSSSPHEGRSPHGVLPEESSSLRTAGKALEEQR